MGRGGGGGGQYCILRLLPGVFVPRAHCTLQVAHANKNKAAGGIGCGEEGGQF